ncbi:hypothetical protein ASPCAL11120 [Aspergillus calidoustus]|uniref:Uncharacterized protein n=1 Tax=Aspergillus calidoustus TaxID=454130 RepID=A0A0U5GBG6_ASPCI|nr:hypothetical protein ASPCAL11120 [Aspergillus calidoustus]
MSPKGKPSFFQHRYPSLPAAPSLLGTVADEPKKPLRMPEIHPHRHKITRHTVRFEQSPHRVEAYPQQAAESGLYQMLKLDLSQHKLKAAVNVGETCGSHLGNRPSIGRTQRLSPPVFWSLSSVGPFLAWNTDRERYHPERVEPKLK